MALEENSAKSQVYTKFRGNVTHATISATCHFWTIFDNCNLPYNKWHGTTSILSLYTVPVEILWDSATTGYKVYSINKNTKFILHE